MFFFSFLTDIRRDNAPELKKAGNLRYAFARTSGEAIAILDADFCPRADFLKETVPYFNHDASIGILQTPQFFRFRDEQTWIEQGAGVTQEFFYRMVQVKIVFLAVMRVFFLPDLACFVFGERDGHFFFFATNWKFSRSLKSFFFFFEVTEVLLNSKQKLLFDGAVAKLVLTPILTGVSRNELT